MITAIKMYHQVTNVYILATLTQNTLKNSDKICYNYRLQVSHSRLYHS